MCEGAPWDVVAVFNTRIYVYVRVHIADAIMFQAKPAANEQHSDTRTRKWNVIKLKGGQKIIKKKIREKKTT